MHLTETIEICFWKGKEYQYGCKKRKCWLPVFFPFTTMFSKTLKVRLCVANIIIPSYFPGLGKR